MYKRIRSPGTTPMTSYHEGGGDEGRPGAKNGRSGDNDDGNGRGRPSTKDDGEGDMGDPVAGYVKLAMAIGRPASDRKTKNRQIG